MKRKHVVWCALALLGSISPWLGAAGPSDGLLSFSEDEVRAILSHGPWPVLPVARDPSNRVSGKPEAVSLGEHLFFDTRLSASGKFSCGTCHVPERSWTDNQTRGAAAGEVARNTPTLMNVRLIRWFGWDGAADSLWSQSMRPILEPRELGATPRHVAALVRSDEELACRYRRAFGSPPSATNDEAVLVDVAKALAAFQETMDSNRVPFDEFRDALARGDRYKASRYSEAAQRGLKLFIGKGGCNTCHTGPNFTNGEFYNTGLASPDGPAATEAGRREGIKQVHGSPFNLTGEYNDDATRAGAAETKKSLSEHRVTGAFKVPTLRNTLLTAPYGHDGRFLTMAEVVRHYSESAADRSRADGGKLKPLKLTAAEQTDLVVFLESLSTFSNPWRPEDLGRCY